MDGSRFGWLASLMLDLITGQQRVFLYRYGSFLVKTRRAHIILIRPMSSDGCAQNSRAEFRDRQAAWERVSAQRSAEDVKVLAEQEACSGLQGIWQKRKRGARPRRGCVSMLRNDETRGTSCYKGGGYRWLAIHSLDESSEGDIQPAICRR